MPRIEREILQIFSYLFGNLKLKKNRNCNTVRGIQFTKRILECIWH
jgi:hypothetical protein